MAVKKIHAGELKTTVSFKQPTVTRVSGQKEIVHAVAFTARAKVVQTNNFRAMESNASSLIDTDTVYVRYTDDRAAVTKDWLINYKNKDRTIDSGPEVIGDNRFLKFIVKAKNA